MVNTVSPSHWGERHFYNRSLTLRSRSTVTGLSDYHSSTVKCKVSMRRCYYLCTMLPLRSILSVPMVAPVETEEAAKLLRRRTVCERPIVGGLSRVRDLRRKSPREARSPPMDDSKTLTFWSELINCPTHLVIQRQQPLRLHTGQLN